MRILIDVDGVIADLVGTLCKELRKHGHNVTEADTTTYDFAGCWTAEQVVIARRAMERPGFCAEIAYYPGAATFVKELHKLGDVVAVTKGYPSGRTWMHEREQWLSDIGIERVVHTAHKEVVNGDYFIEDHPVNAYNWFMAHPNKRAFLITRPWNTGATSGGVRRVDNYAAILQRIRDEQVG